MQNTSHFPAYTLRIVLRETGLSAEVLRAWERRYGLPQPKRTGGGHRLYSENDIETIKWLRARQGEGFSISQAVQLWKDLVASGNDPLENVVTAQRLSSPARTTASYPSVEALRSSWLDACLKFDERAAEEILDRAFAIYPYDRVCTEMLQMGMRRIGEWWVQGKVSVQQEHFASVLAVRRLHALIADTPPPGRTQTVLVGCPPEEWHTLTALMVSLFLRRRGIKVVYLGANIPVEQLVETATTIRPDLIVLAAQQLATAASLRAAVTALREADCHVAFGGLVFTRIPQLIDRIPAVYLGDSLEEAVSVVERLLVTPAEMPARASIEAPYQETAEIFRQQRAVIEAEVQAVLQASGLPADHLSASTLHLGNVLFAALQLGDLSLLETELEWVKDLLANRQQPASTLLPYLAVYSAAVRRSMGQSGEPLTRWFAGYIERNEEVPQ